MSRFTVDHQGFYLEQAPFYPLIQEGDMPLASWSNAVVVRLQAGLSHDLNWGIAKQLAEKVVAEGRWVVWELDLGLPSFTFLPEDVTAFHSFSLALDQFCLQLFPLFKDHTLGVILYKGNLRLEESFPKVWWEASFRQSGSDSYPVFCADLLSDYLHRLVSILPAEVIPFAFFDISSCSSFSYMAHLLLHERFAYITLGLKGSQVPHAGLCWEEGDPAQGYLGFSERKIVKIFPSTGVFLPEDSLWDASLLEKIDQVLAYSHDSGTAIRFIEMLKLTEQWDGLDQIIVPALEKVSLQAKRKFLGFVAAGGSIVHLVNGALMEWDLTVGV